MVDSLLEATGVIQAVFAEDEAVSDLRLNVQVHHVVRQESCDGDRVLMSRSHDKVWRCCLVVSNEADNCQLDTNNHECTQIDGCDLVVIHRNNTEETLFSVQLFGIYERCKRKRINIVLQCDLGLLEVVISISNVLGVPLYCFVINYIDGPVETALIEILSRAIEQAYLILRCKID